MKAHHLQRRIRLPGACCLALSLLLTVGAQTSPSATPTPPPQAPSQSNRVVAVVPAFNVASFGTKTPLTSGQKFHIFWRTTLDPFSLIAPAVKSGIYNAAGLNSGFGSGASGFFKRYGASLTDGTSAAFSALTSIPPCCTRIPDIPHGCRA